MPLSELERRVVAAIAERESELVELLATLIGFDTTTHAVGAPPRDEERLQQFLADRLGRSGATTSLVVPEAEALRPHPMIPDGFSFDGRPQLVARFPGTRNRPDAAAQRAHRRRQRRAAGGVDERPVRRHRRRRPGAGPRRVRHEGRCRRDGLCRGAARGARDRARRRADREHGERGGVDRRRRARLCAHPAGGRRDRSGAERARRLDRLSRLAASRASTSRVAPVTPGSRQSLTTRVEP